MTPYLPPPGDSAYQRSRRELALISDAELEGLLNSFGHELASCAELPASSAEVCRVLVGDRLRAALDVRAARAARFRAGAGPNPRSPFARSWTGLAERVKARTDLVRLFETQGYHLKRRGREYAGACFACGTGDDRMVVFPGPDDRYPFPRAWCRVCGGFWDAIAVARMLVTPGYYDAVAHLAGDLGLAVPAAAAAEVDRA